MMRPAVPVLLIISGAPASGKTTLGRRLASDLHLPFFTKDDFKERLFDHLGWHDRERSSRLGIASYALLYYAVGACLAAGQSVAAESNFQSEVATSEFLRLRDHYPFLPIQVLCWAPEAVLRARFRARGGIRHPGHVDDQVSDDDLGSVLRGGRYEPLAIGGTVIEVETTHPEQVDYRTILEQVQSAVEARKPVWEGNFAP